MAAITAPHLVITVRVMMIVTMCIHQRGTGDTEVEAKEAIGRIGTIIGIAIIIVTTADGVEAVVEVAATVTAIAVATAVRGVIAETKDRREMPTGWMRDRREVPAAGMKDRREILTAGKKGRREAPAAVRQSMMEAIKRMKRPSRLRPPQQRGLHHQRQYHGLPHVLLSICYARSCLRFGPS